LCYTLLVIRSGVHEQRNQHTIIPPKDKNELTKPYKTIFGGNLTKQNFSSTKSPQEQDGQFAPTLIIQFPNIPTWYQEEKWKKEVP
jgi:hypothetical protein